MIETEYAVVIDTGIEQVWDYVQDIRQWANLFPGCKECEVIDDNNSKWVIKVGAGGLVKTINVLVNVSEWNGPEQVNFSYQLESEPVVGRGSYTASKQGNNATEITLHITVEGSGQMASMWEAVSKPLLPQMAKTFSTRLKTEIETQQDLVVAPKPSALAAVGCWLRKLWRSLFAGTSR